MRLTKKMIKDIESKTSCSVSESEDKTMYYIYVDNTCGEDYEIEINKGKDEVEEIIEHCDNYDFEEHFDLWRGANRGEPSSAYTLLKNCEEIGEHLEQLSDLLRGY